MSINHSAASNKILITIWTAFTLLFFGISANSLDDPFGQDDEFLPVEKAYQVTPQLNAESITLDWSIEEGYYLYQHQFSLTARTAEENESIPLVFEPGLRKYDEYFEKELETYHNNTRMTGDHPKLSAPFELVITSQGCAEAGLCYPPRKQYFAIDVDGIALELDQPMFNNSSASKQASAAPQTVPDSFSATPQDSSQSIFLTLVFAVIGGLILNLMPCVFPVLSLKALSFASSHLSSHKQHLHGWAYTAGVVSSFLVAAGAILAAREAGSLLGWGFQLQHPGFVALMAYLFFIMALTLSGMFNVGTSLMGVGQNLTAGHGLKASFFTGVLAALVASPCTAPFMATALGVALTQPVPIALLIFAALGFGMALPFILLSYNPRLAERLPAPGPWMEVLKQFLAFPLYATCVWLLWVFSNQSSTDGAALLVLGAVFVAFGIWLSQRTPASKNGKHIVKALAITTWVLAILLAIKATTFDNSASKNNTGQWVTYSPEALSQELQSGKSVFLNLTADWCITCKVNERIALSSEAFFTNANELNFVLMKGDFTNPDPEISALLEQFNRSGVPLYAVYSAKNPGNPVLLPQVLSTNMVKEAMRIASAQ